MENIISFILLVLIMAVVWYLGYRRGKTIKERELAEMEEPALTKEENEKREQFHKFCKLYDEIMTEDDNDDFFTGDIAKSSRTDTNKDELK